MNEIEIHKFLSKIANSKAFSHSDVYGKLLKYLTEATLNGEKPKEYTIGADVFNQKADSPSTSKVRVSIHNLRKKLDLYYKEEGENDTTIFSIPKGTYTLEFKKKKKNFLATNARKLLIIASPLILITIITLAFQNLTQSDNVKLKKTRFWSELIDNKKETIIVIGDFFIFQEEEEEEAIPVKRELAQVQNPLITSSTPPNEPVIFSKNNSYIPYAAIRSLPYLIPLLDRNNISYEIILSSNFRWETFNNYNIIYIGSLRNLNALSYLSENKLYIKHLSSNNTLTLSNIKGERTYTSTINNNVTTDYTVVAKLPGPSNNVYYLFGSNYEAGCIESIKYFTHLDSVRSFGNTKLKDANFFSGIFKAEGVEDINMLFNLVEYETITDSALTNFWHY